MRERRGASPFLSPLMTRRSARWRWPLVEETGLDAVYSGSLDESWRQQPGSPSCCTDLTREQMPDALAATERARLPKRRDIAI
jgi:hypothetical protein